MFTLHIQRHAWIRSRYVRPCWDPYNWIKHCTVICPTIMETKISLDAVSNHYKPNQTMFHITHTKHLPDTKWVQCFHIDCYNINHTVSYTEGQILMYKSIMSFLIHRSVPV